MFKKIKNRITRLEDSVFKSVSKPIETAYCEECGGLFKKSYMQLVEVKTEMVNFKEFYCKHCKKPYNIRKIFTLTDADTKYFRNETLEVDINGKIIK